MSFKIWFLQNWQYILVVIGIIGLFIYYSYYIYNRGYARWHRDITIANTACEEIKATVGLREQTLFLTQQPQWVVICIAK